MLKLIVVSFMLAAVQPVFAEQAPATPPTTARLGALRQSPQNDPYRKLFATQTSVRSAVKQAQAAQQPQATMLCGATMAPIDSTVDRRLFEARKNDGTRYTMRIVPPECRSGGR